VDAKSIRPNFGAALTTLIRPSTTPLRKCPIVSKESFSAPTAFQTVPLPSDAMREIDRFFREEHRIIVPLTVRETLDEELARKRVTSEHLYAL
jgi:hypothetical protein